VSELQVFQTRCDPKRFLPEQSVLNIEHLSSPAEPCCHALPGHSVCVNYFRR